MFNERYLCITLFDCEHCTSIWQTFSHCFSGNKPQRETFSNHTTIICKQLLTFIECLFIVWNCLWTFVNHLLDVCTGFVFYVCLTFAKCSRAYKKVPSNYVPDLFIICPWTNIGKHWTNVYWTKKIRGGNSLLINPKMLFFC